MPDKTFLGLGFSFAAEDKGLEKYLQSVKGLVSDISSGVDGLGKSSKKFRGFTQAAGGTSGSRGKARPRNQNYQKNYQNTPRTTRRQNFQGKTSDRQERKESVAKDTFENLGDKVSKFSKHWTDSFGKIFKGKDFDRFQQNLMQVTAAIDKQGHISLGTQLRVLQAAKEVAKEARVFAGFRDILGTTGKYMGHIINQANEIFDNTEVFLQSIGMDFRKMIPPQFSAAAKLAKSIFMIPVKIGKFFGKEIINASDKSHQKNLLKGLKSIEKKLGRSAGGSKNNVLARLQSIDEKTFKSEKGGGSLGNLLGAGLFVAMAGTLAYFSDKVKYAIQIFDGIIKAVAGFNWLKKFESVGSAFDKIGAYIRESKVVKWFDGIGEFLGKAGSKIMEGIRMLSKLPIVGNLFTALEGLIKIVGVGGKIFGKLFSWPVALLLDTTMAFIDALKEGGTWPEIIGKTILNGLDNFFFHLPSLLGKAIGKTAFNLKNMIFGKTEEANILPPRLQKSYQEKQMNNVIDMKSRQPVTTTPTTITPSSISTQSDPIDERSRRLRESIAMKNQNSQLKNMEQQLEILKDQNQKFDDLLLALAPNRTQAPLHMINISHDARKAGIIAEQKATDYFFATGGN